MHRFRHTQRAIVFTLALLSVLFSSCAYFNTFHNTKELYREALKERQKRQGAAITAAEKKKYDDTIAKASKILEVYPDSKYVDDALFILGECLYYKEEYIKAQRKFQELGQYFPKSKYYHRARIWLAKSNIEMQDYSSARLVLTELLKKEKLKDEIREESRFLLGEIHFKQQSYDPAELEYKAAAHTSRSKMVKSKAYYQLGECQIINGKPIEAAASFKSALKYDTQDVREFEALLSYARALKLSGDFNAAKTVCEDLLENELFKRKHGFVQLELADITYRRGVALLKKSDANQPEYLGKVHDALEQYELLVLENKRSEAAATAYYRMARIYELDLRSFAKAKENYDKVKIEFNKSEYVAESSRRARDIGELIRLNNLVKKAQGEALMDEAGNSYGLSKLELLLLEHGVHPELRLMTQRKKIARLEKSLQLTENEKPPVDENEQARIRQLNELMANKLQLAETYRLQFGQVDSALAEYAEIMDLFKDHPEAPKAVYSSALIYADDYDDQVTSDSLLQKLMDEYPLSEQSVAARLRLGLPVAAKHEPAMDLYQAAERDLFERQNIPQAIDNYQKVADDFPNSEFAPKALYAIGWIHEQIIFDNARAAMVYGEIMKRYPDSEYSGDVSKKMSAMGRGPAPPAGEQAEPGQSPPEGNVKSPATEGPVPEKPRAGQKQIQKQEEDPVENQRARAEE